MQVILTFLVGHIVLKKRLIKKVYLAGKKDGFSLQNITTCGPNLQKINVVERGNRCPIMCLDIK